MTQQTLLMHCNNNLKNRFRGTGIKISFPRRVNRLSSTNNMFTKFLFKTQTVSYPGIDKYRAGASPLRESGIDK